MDSDPGSNTMDYHSCCWSVTSSPTPSLEGLKYDNLLAARKWSAPQKGEGRA